MKQKIAIIGGGLFGITAYIKLKRKGFDCSLFEKKKDLLCGASTNNLNRVHFGYHYPRDKETAKQSYKGYLSFNKFYNNSIIKKFDNYYFIANKSKVSFKKYINFCYLNNLKFKNLNLKNFFLKNKNIAGGIKVNEPIYDWKLIKKNINSKIDGLKTNKIYKNVNVNEITRLNKKYVIKTNKKNYFFDYIVDCSYEGSNSISKKILSPKKLIYQLVIVFEAKSFNLKKKGIALMDGSFFSFLPKGKCNNLIFYHVKHSILKKKISKFFPIDWYSFNLIKKTKLKLIKKKIQKDVKKFFPEINFKFTNRYFISPRVFPLNSKKTDKRVSSIHEIKKGYFKIFSAKIDHCVDIADILVKNFKEKNIINL